MKIKSVIAAILVACMLTGCQLAKEDTSNSKDRLIGVLLTREHLDLFDLEGYLSDNLNKVSDGEIKLNGETSQYQGRLYATFLDENKNKVKFGDVDGIPFFVAEHFNENGEKYTHSYNGDGLISSSFGTFYGDDEDKITMDGTIYIVPSVANLTHYFNPVYQSADGKIYATSGQGMSVSSVQSQGEVMSTNLEETIEITENKKNTKKTTIINFAVETKLPPHKINVFMLDSDHKIISTNEYAPIKMPAIINVNENAEYIIVESYITDFDGNQLVERKLYDKATTMINTFYESNNSILAQQSIELTW